MTPPFHQRAKCIWKITSPCTGLNDWQSHQRNRKEKTQLPAETVWSLIESLLKVRPDVSDISEIVYSLCQTFLSKTRCRGPGDIFKQFPVDGQKFMQHNTNLRGSLRLMVTSLGHHQNEVKHQSRTLAAEKKSRRRRWCKPLSPLLQAGC